MNALGLYFKAFRGKELFLLYRDKVQSEIEADLRSSGDLELCSDDTILDFVDRRTEQLVLMFNDEKRLELLSQGIDAETVDKIIIPRLQAKLNKWTVNDGQLESLRMTVCGLKVLVEQSYLENSDLPLYPDTHLHAPGLLKTLALLASWAPEDEVTPYHRHLRAELVAKAEVIANQLKNMADTGSLGTESLRREYVEFIWNCYDLALCGDLRLGRIMLNIGVRLVRPE